MTNPDGRPKGIKESRPRIKRTDVLNANREKWAQWSQTDGALKAARSRLRAIVSDEKSSDKDAILAAKLLLQYDIGTPTEAKEQLPVQPLNIFLSAPDGTFVPLAQQAKQIDLEVTDSP